VHFLHTQSGSLNADYILLIGHVIVRSSGNYCEIDYTDGAQRCTTRASEGSVTDFFQELDDFAK
jgi:hypothetical protein